MISRGRRVLQGAGDTSDVWAHRGIARTQDSHCAARSGGARNGRADLSSTIY